MKMGNYKLVFLITFTISSDLFSQTTGNRTASATLPVVTLLDIEPAGAIAMNFIAPTEAGRPIVSPAINTSKWINYTSAIAAGGLSRKITASVSPVIPGIDIKFKQQQLQDLAEEHWERHQPKSHSIRYHRQ